MLKSAFARAARSIKRVPVWHWTELSGSSILLGTIPTQDEELLELKDAGVRAIVTLNEAWEPQVAGGVGAACERAGLRHLHLPTPDYSAPSQADIQRAVRFIEEQVASGGKVYVHCNAGRGRSAVCVLAYLMKARGLSAEQAYMLVAGERRITKLPTRLGGFVRPQWRALLEFEKGLRPRLPQAESKAAKRAPGSTATKNVATKATGKAAKKARKARTKAGVR